MFKYIFIFLLSFSHLFAIVEINNASATQLLELNGIGKAKSQKIVNYRIKNGCFKSVDELARIDGISKKLIRLNRGVLRLGKCTLKTSNTHSQTNFIDVLLNPINIVFSSIIFLLAFLDQKTGKDLKSQIVSMGVLGTFVGIFIGLQAFNPEDITHSVNDILEGLKIAFFTSIIGMSVSTILSIYQKFTREIIDE